MFVKADDWTPTQGITLEGTALEVVRSTSSLSVLAGPGAGKTELLAQRAAYLLNTGLCPPPKRILAIAFKVDAARNLQARVGQRCEQQVARRFESLTLHAFAKRTLDQFREALDEKLRPSPNYKVIFPNRDTWLAFQQDHSAEVPALCKYNPNQLANIIQGSLPDFSENNPQEHDRLRWLWWRTSLEASPSNLSFDMIMLLATHIIRTQPLVRKAIAGTYTHVFLDEFQDVTGQQYNLIREIFRDSTSVLTAVGDTNQAIMGFAGALPGIFNTFGADFSASNRKLLFNFRSNSRIVDLINSLSQMFSEEPSVPTESARRDIPPPADALEGWMFSTRDTEAAGIANFVRTSIEADPELHAHDFVILTRLRADVIETRLLPYFTTNNLRLRNEARSLGPLSIQDIVRDPVFLFMTALLKMAHGIRDGTPFQTCRDLLASLDGIDLSTDKGSARSLQAIQQLVASTVNLTRDKAPAAVDIKNILAMAFPGERRDKLIRVFKEYQSRDYLDSVLDACAAFYSECAADTPTWPALIANLEGLNAVKIMTIHKSKGLEYHTVIFVEFNDDAFWKNDDDLNVFFVALSRARERVRFSLTSDSKGFNNVRHFLEKLEASGIEFKPP